MVRVESNDKSMVATSGKVTNGGNIEINNIFSDEAPEFPYTFNFTIYSSQNQNAAVDAGPWEVSTYNRFDDDPLYYFVGEGASESGFVALVGQITYTEGVKITNAETGDKNDVVTSGLGSLYTFKFKLNGGVEKNG